MSTPSESQMDGKRERLKQIRATSAVAALKRMAQRRGQPDGMELDDLLIWAAPQPELQEWVSRAAAARALEMQAGLESGTLDLGGEG